MIRDISFEDLRHMRGAEGIILRGCGDDAQSCLKGLNSLLNIAHILKNDSQITSCGRFIHSNLTCMLFPLDGVEYDETALKNWLHGTDFLFRGIMLTDFVERSLGGFVQEEEAEEENPEMT